MQALYPIKQIYSQLFRVRKSYFMIGLLFILFIHSTGYNSIQLEITDLKKNNAYQTIENSDFMPFERELSIREKTDFKIPSIKPPIIPKGYSVETIIDYISSPKIIIDGNVDFHAQALGKWDDEGNLDGSPSKPYLIEDLDINPLTSSEDAISIQNTDVYFNISSCLLHGGRWGIYFNSVSHGVIHNNIIKDNNEEGVKLENSPNNSFILNEIYNNTYNGIYLRYCENNTLLSNIVYNNSLHGIILYYSGNSTATNNLVYENDQYGLILENSYNCTLINNFAHDNQIEGPWYSGIKLDNCSYSIIRDNTILNEPSIGLEVVKSFYCIISNITAINGGSAEGVLISNCRNNTIDELKSYSNNDRGIVILDSGNSTFTNLISINNGGTGISYYSCGNSTISNLLSINNTNTGVYIEYSGDSEVKDIHCENNTAIGFYFRDSNNSILTNITCIENSNNGLELAWSSYCFLTDILSQGNSERGIRFEEVHHSTLEKSYSYSNWLNGISLEKSSYNTLIANEIYNTGSGSTGVVLGYKSNNNIVKENYIYRNSGNGLSIYSSNNNSKITSNNIYNNGGYGIEFSNSFGHNISYNIVYNNTDDGIRGYFDSELTTSPFKNTITRNDLIHNRLGSEVFYQINIYGQTDMFNVHHNFYDTHRIPDENNDDIVDYPYPIGEVWTGGPEAEYYYDEFPETEPLNPAIIHYLSTPYIIYPSTWDPTHPFDYQVIDLNGTVPIQFLAPIDSESHSLTYSLYYTQDWNYELNLQNWTLLVSGITTTTYEWDTTALIDGPVFLAVAATCSDGIESIYIDQRNFQINNTPPELTNIMSSPFPTVSLILIAYILLVIIERKKEKD